jgi:hypothetical protein
VTVSQIATVFTLNRKGFKPDKGVSVVVMTLLALIVLAALDKEQYLNSVLFGALYTALSGLGGAYGYVVPRMALSP